jgi:hypothetical protein
MDQLRQSCPAIQAVAYGRLTQYPEESRTSANQIGLINTLGSVGLLVLLAYSNNDDSEWNQEATGTHPQPAE